MLGAVSTRGLLLAAGFAGSFLLMAACDREGSDPPPATMPPAPPPAPLPPQPPSTTAPALPPAPEPKPEPPTRAAKTAPPPQKQAPKPAPARPAPPADAPAAAMETPVNKAPEPAPAAPAPAPKVVVPATANVRIEIPRGLQALLDADPRMQPWVNKVMTVIDRCYANERARSQDAAGVVELAVTMQANARPEVDIRSVPTQLGGVVACATPELMRARPPLFTGPEGERHVVRVRFSR
jgi:outer membrane biosynthesis protein TonB